MDRKVSIPCRCSRRWSLRWIFVFSSDTCRPSLDSMEHVCVLRSETWFQTSNAYDPPSTKLLSILLIFYIWVGLQPQATMAPKLQGSHGRLFWGSHWGWETGNHNILSLPTFLHWPCPAFLIRLKRQKSSYNKGSSSFLKELTIPWTDTRVHIAF